MWSDKCEWKHGFTKFGAWHPTTSFRSKTVGKQQRTTDSAPVLKIHTATCEIDFNINHKNYNFLNRDRFKKLLFPTNSLAKLLSDSLLSDSLLSDSLLSDSLLSDSLLSDSSTNQSNSKL